MISVPVVVIMTFAVVAAVVIEILSMSIVLESSAMTPAMVTAVMVKCFEREHYWRWLRLLLTKFREDFVVVGEPFFEFFFKFLYQSDLAWIKLGLIAVVRFKIQIDFSIGIGHYA